MTCAAYGDRATHTANGVKRTVTDTGDDMRGRKRAKVVADSPRPEFLFDTRGFAGGRHIEISALRDFILHLLLESREPNWILTKNRSAISHIVALLVPGITAEALGLPPQLPSSYMPVKLSAGTGAPPAGSLLPTASTLFALYCPTRAPGDKYRLHSALQTFTNVPLSPAQKAKREREASRPASTAADVTQYLLSSETMDDAAFPMPTYAISGRPSASRPPKSYADWVRDDGFIETPQECGRSGQVRLFGLDCEMVITEGGQSELARVSVVNEHDEVVYETLVMPEKPVVEYATQWSGITERRLRGVQTRLHDVHKRLTGMFDYNTILIGHSLDCDLRVLKLAHPWVVDTSVLYQHTRGPPFKPSLRWLAQRWLEREIQVPNSKDVGVEERVGHDSTEDATAAIDLVKLKLAKGPHFGEFASDTESILERLSRHRKTTAVIDHGTPAQWHGAKATTAIACTTDDEVMTGITRAVPHHDFVFARLLELSHAIGWSQPSSAVLRQAAAAAGAAGQDARPAPSLPADEGTATNGDMDETERRTAAFAALDARLGRLHATLPAGTALILFTGHSDPRPLTQLSQRKQSFDRLWKAKQTMSAEEGARLLENERWTEDDDRSLQAEADLARMGMSFFCVRKADQ